MAKGAKEAKETTASAQAQDSYNVPALKRGERHVNEIIIKRSRFITSIAHTASVDEAKAFIETVSAENRDATHNCFAYNATAPLSTAFCGCSDDGEPKGTAGHPMLTVVLHCGIGELTAVVTRYFGGVLLGTGGLVKAYQDSVKEALETLPVGERMIAARMALGIDHKFVAKFHYILPRYRATVTKEDYAEIAYFEVELPVHEVDALERELVNLTSGTVKIIGKY